MADTKTQEIVARKLFEWATKERWQKKEIAEKLNVSQQTLTNWKNRGVPATAFSSVARLLEVPIEVLLSPPGSVSVSGKTKLIPLINWVHAGEWTEICDTTFDEYIPTVHPCSDRSFCLRVEGDSMLPVFHQGDIVFVDPERQPQPGRYVVAIKGEDNEATLKKYRALGLNQYGIETFELVPENPIYASYRSDQVAIRIIGVVFGYHRDI